MREMTIAEEDSPYLSEIVSFALSAHSGVKDGR
jgi:hypothetical protein